MVVLSRLQLNIEWHTGMERSDGWKAVKAWLKRKWQTQEYGLAGLGGRQHGLISRGKHLTATPGAPRRFNREYLGRSAVHGLAP